MKIKIPAKGLDRMLSVVGRAAAKAATVQVLTGVLFEAKKGSPDVLRVSATDMEIVASVAVAAQGGMAVEEEGSVVIPAGVLSQVVRSLPEGDITLAADEPSGRVVLAHGGNEYKMAYYPAQDYPRPQAFPAEGAFSVPAQALAETAEKVLPAASKDHTKPVITGVLVSFSEDKVHMVATDSYRLSIKETALTPDPSGGAGPAEERRALIPARGMAEAARLVANLSGDAGAVRVALTENAALFSAAGVVLSTRLIGGEYPKWEKLLPKEFSQEFTVDAREIIGPVKRANLFATRQSPPAPLRLSFSAGQGSLTEPDGALTITTETKQTGAAREKLAAAYSGPGDGFAIAFDGTYLAAGLEACGSENVRIRCNGPSSPALIAPLEEGSADSDAGRGAGNGFAYMIMPMRDAELEEKPAAASNPKETSDDAAAAPTNEAAAEKPLAEERQPEPATA